MATSLSLENDSSLAQGYLKVNGTTAATLTTSGITGNVTGNVTGNADTATKLSTTTGSAPSYACRAWVNFDGTRDTSGAVSTANTNRFIRSSGNVTSVLRTGAGTYTITFTTPMSDANYSVNISYGTSNGGILRINSITANNFSLTTTGTGGVAYDDTINCASIFGN
jgi:hypothetical protein